MHYTVIGATGFVGRRLTAALLEAGDDGVFAPTRDDRAVFEKNLGHVFYCAGLTADFRLRPAATVEAHAGLLSRILESASFDHLVYLSSTRLYDSSADAVGRAQSQLSLDPRNPRHLYDLSKALGENLCLTLIPERSSVARLSCVFDWSPGSPGFLSELLQRAARERTFILDTASGYVRDYIHLDDCVRVLHKLARESAAGITNVASGENISNGDLVSLLNNRGWNIKLGSRSEPQSLARCDIERLVELGVKPRGVTGVIENWIDAVKRETH